MRSALSLLAAVLVVGSALSGCDSNGLDDHPRDDDPKPSKVMVDAPKAG